MWATILALVWLHGLQSEARDEWQLLALKAAAWLRAQKGKGGGGGGGGSPFWTPKLEPVGPRPLTALSFSLLAPGALECVEAANALLGCRVPSDTLGI